MKYKKEFFLLLSSIVITIIFFEIFLLFADIDARLLENALYYQYADLEVHKASNDSNRLYELIPYSSVIFPGVYPNETKYSSRKVSINSLGFRDKERNKTKPKGIFRIVILGGSNTYGATVGDEDTYPAIMQKLLDEQFPGKFEVWNGGISAYVMSQKVAYAEYIIKEFNPDLLIFQVHNDGRRAFLYDGKFIGLFKKNKELYLENIPFLFSNNPTLLKIHYCLVSHSRVYRFIIININNKIIKDLKLDFIKEYKQKYPYDKIIRKYSEYGDIINRRNFDNFINNHQDIKIIIFDPILQRYCDSERKEEYENIEYFSLCYQDKPKEYKELHPPSYVYEWYAQELVNMLINKSYIKIVK